MLLLLCCLQVNDLCAQVIRGRVIDSKSGKSVPYVNIFLEKSSKGTVTNAEGEFNFRLPSDAPDEETLAFSHIGYSKFRISVGEAKRSGKLLIQLPVEDQELMEALVTTLDPKKIMKKMQENLVATMYPDAYEVEVFYREVIQDQDGYQGLARARGFLHAEPFDLKHSKNIAVSNHFLVFDQVQKTNYGIITSLWGTPRHASYHTEVIFEMWDFNLSWFDYELLGQRMVADRMVYVIKTSPKGSSISNKGKRWNLWRYGLLEDATFYIDQEDHGVHMMELGQQYPQEQESSKYRMSQWVRKNRDAVVKYRRNEQGNYLFSYITYSNRYTSLGFQTQEIPERRDVTEYAEMYAMDYEFVDLSLEELRKKYKTVINGEKPFRMIRYPVPYLNGWMFFAGDPRYHESFWNEYEYPAMSKESEIEASLSKEASLESQFKKFSNDQRYLLPIIKKKYNLESVEFWSVDNVQKQFKQSANTFFKYGYFK